MPLAGESFIALVTKLLFPKIKLVWVNPKASSNFGDLVPALRNHFDRRNLEILVKPPFFSVLFTHGTPPIFKPVFILKPTLRCVHFFGGRSLSGLFSYPTTLIWNKYCQAMAAL